MEGSRAQSFDINNELLRKAQATGIVESSGKVSLDYYGHSSFKVTTPNGISVLIDPWRNDSAWGLWFPRDFPEITVDIAIATHAHFDHDALHMPKARIVMERLIGEYTLSDLKIIGLGDKHLSNCVGKTRWTEVQLDFGESFLPPNNNLHMDNCIYVIQSAGVTIVHWGDNRPQPDEWVDNYLKNLNIDILILPIDESEHILTYKQAKEIMLRYSPALTVPMHYLIRGTNTTLSTLQPADEFISNVENVMNINSARLEINANEHDKKGEVVAFFGDNVFTE